MNSGIYKITNIITNQHYIGSSSNLKDRLKDHQWRLSNNKHENKRLKNSCKKYGYENFKFEVLATCPLEYLINMEQWFLDTTKPYYNIRKVAERNSGVKHTKKEKEKIRQASLKMWVKIKNGTLVRKEMKGENNPFSNLKNDDIIQIKNLIMKGNISIREISEYTGVGIKQIQMIKRGDSWGHILPELTEKLRQTKLPVKKRVNEKVKNIKLDILSKKYTGREISDKYSISLRSLFAIKNLGNWKDICPELNNNLSKLILYTDKRPKNKNTGNHIHIELS